MSRSTTTPARSADTSNAHPPTTIGTNGSSACGWITARPASPCSTTGPWPTALRCSDGSGRRSPYAEADRDAGDVTSYGRRTYADVAEGSRVSAPIRSALVPGAAEPQPAAVRRLPRWADLRARSLVAGSEPAVQRGARISAAAATADVRRPVLRSA